MSQMYVSFLSGEKAGVNEVRVGVGVYIFPQVRMELYICVFPCYLRVYVCMCVGLSLW